MRDEDVARVDQDLVGFLESDIAGRDGPTAYLLPSTRDAFDAAGRLLHGRHNVTVVAPSMPTATRPTQLLARLRSEGGTCPDVVLIFSDQLVAPELATVRVNGNDSVGYMSGLEAIMCARHGYVLRALLDSRLESAVPLGGMREAIALLKRYFVACRALGDDWLMRDRQVERERGWRLHESRLRLRYFQSAVFFAYSEKLLDEAGLLALRRIDEVAHYLANGK